MAEHPSEPILDRDDVTAIFLWMTDVIAELREIRKLLQEDDGQEEE